MEKKPISDPLNGSSLGAKSWKVISVNSQRQAKAASRVNIEARILSRGG